MWSTRACEIPTNLHGQLVRLYREVMLEHDSSWLGIQFILGSSYTAICATATWPCMSKLSQSKRRRRATGKNRMLKQANSTSNMDLPSNTAQWPVGTEYLPGISFPFLGKSAPVQYCTHSPVCSVVESEVQNAMEGCAFSIWNCRVWCSLLWIFSWISGLFICQASIPFRAKTKPEASAIPNRACSRTQ